MTDVELRKLAASQDDIVAAWQLAALGWTRHRILHHARSRSWRRVHDGVFALGHAPLTARRRRIAATVSAPSTFLHGASAAAHWGFRPWEAAFETVVRPGSGGPRRIGALRVARSTTLAGMTTRHEGIAPVTAARALVDLAAVVPRHELERCFREAIRLHCTSARELSRLLRGQRGTAALVELCDRHATVPYHRCRSDAESRALEVLEAAEIAPPRVNVRIARLEADLVWPAERLIVEIDGAQYHRFPEEDARKDLAWRTAGYTVVRLPSDDVYHRPERLLQAVNVHMCR